MGACSGRETALLLMRSVNLYRYDCYTALFSALEQNHCALACNSKWVTSFFIVRFELPPMWYTYSTVWLLTWLVTREPSRCVPCTPAIPYHGHRMSCHFIQSHIRRVHAACLHVTCHLQFWQNDLDLLRATAVAWGNCGFFVQQITLSLLRLVSIHDTLWCFL